MDCTRSFSLGIVAESSRRKFSKTLSSSERAMEVSDEKQRERNKRMFNQLNTRIARHPGAEYLPQFRAASMENPYKNIWPYWYSFDDVVVAGFTTTNAYFSVSQEADFVWLSTVINVYEVLDYKGANQMLVAIDRNQPNIAIGEANPVRISFRDPQSQRTYSTKNIPIDAYGYGTSPSQLPRGTHFKPNSQLQCVIANADASRVFVPQITLFGYRVYADYMQ